MLKYNKKENYEIYDLVLNHFIFFYSLKTKEKVRHFSFNNYDKTFTLKKNNFSIRRVRSYPTGTLASDGMVLSIVDYTKNIYSLFDFDNIELDFIEKDIKDIDIFINLLPDFNKNSFFIHVSKSLKEIEISKNNKIIKFNFNNLNDLSFRLNKLFFVACNLESHYQCESESFTYAHLKIRDIIDYD